VKRIARVFVIEVVVLYLVSQVAAGLVFKNGATSLIATGIALGAAAFLVKPVINILILPLNLLTFGLFKWVGNAIVLFLVDFVLPQFTIGAFKFLGLHSSLLTLPSFSLPEGALSYFAFSFLISIITTIIYWFVS
jgi:putative membrane protein